MTERLYSSTIFFLSTLLLAFSPTPGFAAEIFAIPPDYTAVYKVMHKGDDLAGVTIQLSHQDETWTLHGYTHDMQGLADLLKVKGAQTVTGRWQDGNFKPDNYDFSFSLVGYNSAWQASFDWSADIVTTSGKSGNVQLPLTGGAFDPFSLSLNVGSLLEQGQTHMEVNIVDEDKLKTHVYQVEMEEPVDTALGCLETTRVKRIRNKKSKRTSLAWYANDYSYIPVQMRHFKKNGKGLSMQIVSLEVKGQPIRAVASCMTGDAEARQAGAG
jgi:hypothetical protein